MKFDLFVSTLDNTPNRVEWSRKCLNNYAGNPHLRITVLDAGSPAEQLDWFKAQGFTVVPQPTEGSVFRRFLLAEALAQGDYYLFSDNDILPISEEWLARGLETARNNAGYGYIVYRLTNTDFSGTGQGNADVREIHKGGGLAIVKRDIRTAPFRIPYIPDPNKMDDHNYCEAIRKSGYGVGMFEKLYVEHLGRTESTQCPK